MYQVKTKETDESVIAFINKIEHARKREEAFRLLELFTEATNLPAKMWGPSIIGFGSIHYKYASGHEGDTMMIGFSPRKAKISLYLATEFPERDRLMLELGKYAEGVVCIYVNKLADIRLDILKEMIERSIEAVKKMNPGEHL